MFAVGVDVSNGRSMVAVLGARRSVVVQPHEVPHTADGFAELAARLHALDGEDRIVMEHTGRYYESFAMSMYRAGFFVSDVYKRQPHIGGTRWKTQKRSQSLLCHPP